RPACVEVADVAFDHPEAGRRWKPYFQDLVEVGAMAGGEIVDSNDLLTESEQLLQEIGADESRHPGDHPHSGAGPQLFSQLSVRCGDHGFTVEGVPAGSTQGKSAREHAGP